MSQKACRKLVRQHAISNTRSFMPLEVFMLERFCVNFALHDLGSRFRLQLVVDSAVQLKAMPCQEMSCSHVLGKCMCRVFSMGLIFRSES